MMMKTLNPAQCSNKLAERVLQILLLLTSMPCMGVTVTDDFTQATDQSNWVNMSYNGYPCLTAGANAPQGASSVIPACTAISDTAGSGALRLTPAQGSQHGAIVSSFTFPSNQGLQATFTTYTYGGSRDGLASEGADGMSFFLMDGSVSTSVGGGNNLGSWGGSLAYTCSNANAPYTGLTGAYLGLGMDEYGNFLNSGDNTASGIPVQTSSTATNGHNNFTSGSYQQANRIGLRGAGNVSWYWLHANYPSLYNLNNSSDQQTAVKNTCSSGLLQNGISGTKVYSVSNTTPLSWANGALTVNLATNANIQVGSKVNIGSSNSSNPPKCNGVSVVGSYVVSGVSGNSFTVLLPNGSNSFSNGANATVTVSVLDYSVIPGGYWVLPSTQLLANENTSTRTNAWPITYRLQITPAGYLTFMYSYNGGAYQTVLSNLNMTTSNLPLPTTWRFGFAGSTGGSTNVHEITCFAAEPIQSSSSAAANTVQAGQVRIGTQEYLSSYNPNNWTASLVSKELVNTNGVISVANTANWDGACVLSGGGCASMGTDANSNPINTVTLESPASRQLLSWNGTAGIPLEWANLTAAQKTLLNSSDNNGQFRLNWLRGDRSEEQSTTPPGPLRIRAGVLGDIINSSPAWVGPPAMNYAATITDALYGAGSETSYATFKSSMATRLNVVYSGSNDGLVHGFRTGSNSADGSYNSANNDGYEVIGYMPATVLGNSNVVGLTNPTYGHNYFVDATPGSGDLYYGGAWHTWLVGALGAGSVGVYALDVTDPTQFSENNASSLVMGDWTAAALANLGKITGTPLIRRLHNGQWAILFGNGLGSSNGLAGVYIGFVNPTTGAVTFKWLSTGAGSTSTPDGISSVASADLDADHVTDYLYAGDLLGNVWRFDLTSSNPNDWAVSKYGQVTATPLFVAKDSNGNRQPITTQIAVTGTITGGANRVVLGFGTGQASPVAMSAANTYAPGTQTVYGIWDWDMNAWNNGSTSASNVAIPAGMTKYAALSEITASPYRTYTRADLYTDTNVTQTGGYATMATATVCWNGSLACSSGNTQYGWRFDLPGMVQGAGEQIIYSPVFSGGELVLNTTIPATTTLGQCSPVLPSGWTRAFNMASGGGNDQNVFANSTGSFSASTNSSSGISGTTASVVAIQQNGVGTPWVVSIGSQQYLISQTTTGNAIVSKFQPQGSVTVSRITWEELL